MNRPLTLSRERAARFLDVPVRMIPLLQAHGVIPRTGDGLVPEVELRRRMRMIPWLSMLGVPMSEPEMRRLVDKRIRFGPRSSGLGVEPFRGHRMIRPWEVLERAWRPDAGTHAPMHG